jgi:hypothetical protein
LAAFLRAGEWITATGESSLAGWHRAERDMPIGCWGCPRGLASLALD